MILSADRPWKSNFPVRPLVILTVCLFPILASAGDWPQILGPHRNGVAEGEKLAGEWPAAGPPLLWEKQVGSGLAGIAVSGDTAVLFHRSGREEIAEALSAKSGKTLWKASFPARYVSSISPDDGPRCVPVIHEGFVYLHGAEGTVSCVSMKDGAKQWSRDLRLDYNAPEGYFGAGSSPIVEGDKLLVNVGGRDGAGIIAVSLKTGETVWKATDEGASYSSPVVATIDGVRQAIFTTRLNTVSVKPDTGEVLWSIPFGQRGPTVNGANPLVVNDRLFLTASYGIGAKFAKLSSDDAEVLWENDDTLSSQFTTCVEHDGVLYGIHGRQDIGQAALRAFEPETGKVLWTEEGFGMATLILAGDKILAMKIEGELVLLEANAKSYEELASATIFTRTAQALPALSNGRLFVRDTSTLKCLQVGATK